MIYFVAGLFVLGLSLLFMKWLSETSPRNIKITFVFILSFLLAVASFVLFFAGKLILSIPSLVAAFIAYQRYRFLKNIWNNVNGNAQNQNNEGTRNSGLTREKAAKILGVSIEASPQEIKAAHKELMKKFHPDHGGNSYQASEINEAKDILLNKNGK